MEYKENLLSYEDYRTLRESVGWHLFSKNQMQQALDNSLYTIVAVENNQSVGMGRLIGDGMYFLIVDVVVHPVFQKCGIGTNIMNMLLKYVEKKTPTGGRSSVQLVAEKGKEPFLKILQFCLPYCFSAYCIRLYGFRNFNIKARKADCRKILCIPIFFADSLYLMKC